MSRDQAACKERETILRLLSQSPSCFNEEFQGKDGDSRRYNTFPFLIFRWLLSYATVSLHYLSGLLRPCLLLGVFTLAGAPSCVQPRRLDFFRGATAEADFPTQSCAFFYVQSREEYIYWRWPKVLRHFQGPIAMHLEVTNRLRVYSLCWVIMHRDWFDNVTLDAG